MRVSEDRDVEGGFVVSDTQQFEGIGGGNWCTSVAGAVDYWCKLDALDNAREN